MADQHLPNGFVPINEACANPGQYVNVVGVVADFRSPMISKGSDWTLSFTICDKSRSLISTGLTVRIFKPQSDHLPVIKSNGDIILLRNLKITNFSGKLVGISHYDTTWVTSHLPSHPSSNPTTSTYPSTVEPKKFELDYIRHLQSWWTARGGAAGSRGIEESSYKKVEAVLDRKRKFSLIKDMQIDCFYDIIGHVVKTFPGNGNFTLYLTDYTWNPMLHCYEWGKSGGGSENDDHAYTGKNIYDGGNAWNGPFGQYTLQVTLWDIHAVAAKNDIHEGMFVGLNNVRAKRNGDGNLEGALHGDRKFPRRVDFEVIRNTKDPKVRQVIQRQQEYSRKFESHKARYEKDMEDKLAKKRKRELEIKAREEKGNKNVRCSRPSEPITLIGSINGLTDADEPFSNRKYRIYGRVIDYLPHNLEDFSKPKKHKVRSARKGSSDSGTNHEKSEGEEKEDYSIEPRIEGEWTWRFALLVQGKDGETMRVIVEGDGADFLLKMDAVDLRKNPQALATLREKLFVLWGDLEERKQHKIAELSKNSSSSSNPTINQQKRKRQRKRRHGDDNQSKWPKYATPAEPQYDELGKRLQNTQDSDDDDEEQKLGKRLQNTQDSDDDDEEQKDGDEENQPLGGEMFEASVVEYGVRRLDGKGWKRMFKLFDTTIL